MSTNPTTTLLTALLEIARRTPWRSEAEERWILSLLGQFEAATVSDAGAHIIPPAPPDAPAPARPSSGPAELDYDKLAEAMLRAQARAAGRPLPTDGTPAEPPPAPPGAVVASPDATVPVSQGATTVWADPSTTAAGHAAASATP